MAPRLALVSCGRDNLYGHSAQRTIAALRDKGSLVLRTDQDGAIAIVGEGKGLGAARD